MKNEVPEPTAPRLPKVEDQTALQKEVEQATGLPWEAATARIEQWFFHGIIGEYRQALLRFVHQTSREAITTIGKALGKDPPSISRWFNTDYSPIEIETILHGFCALDPNVKLGQLPRGRKVVGEAARWTVSMVCQRALNLDTHTIGAAEWVLLLETRKAYWEAARQEPKKRNRATRELLTTIRSYTSLQPTWTFQDVERQRRAWERGWHIYRMAIGFDWAFP